MAQSAISRYDTSGASEINESEQDKRIGKDKCPCAVCMGVYVHLLSVVSVTKLMHESARPLLERIFDNLSRVFQY